MTVTLTINDNASDCYCAAGGGSFNSTDVLLAIADFDVADRDIRTWIPFTVQLARGTEIISANLKVTAAQTSTPNTYTINVACEAADNASNPASGADLASRAKTSANSDYTLAQYINGNVYTYDVTSMVQEVLNRSGWVRGNQLAVIIDDVDTDGKRHVVHSNEAGSNIPYLEIVLSPFMPRGAGIL